jgi:outer membrane receptor protein involved in Fe transport
VETDSTTYRIRYGTSYGWLNWEADFGPTLSAMTVASLGHVTQDRDGKDYWAPGDPPVLTVDDETTTQLLGLRQDWRMHLSPRVMMKWGFDLERKSSDYDYFRARFSHVPNETDPSGPDYWPQHDTVAVVTTQVGTEAGGYLAGRVQAAEGITLELGLRLDGQTHTGEKQFSPRVQAAWQLASGTAIRGAWGHYHQSHAVNELWASDADTTFYPTQRAEHRILGLEHRFGRGYDLRVEAYQRLLSDPLPEYRRLARNMGALWEEALSDRIRVAPGLGRSEGIELFLKSPREDRFAWSASYALSRTEEKLDGIWVPRPFDQRHAVGLQVAYRPTSDWTFAAGWFYHSPWPYTELQYLTGETVWGNLFAVSQAPVLNQNRMIPYRRMDFRTSRRFQVGEGEVLFYLDVFNLFNRENALDYEQSPVLENGRFVNAQSLYPQLQIIPSLGMRWTF